MGGDWISAIMNIADEGFKLGEGRINQDYAISRMHQANDFTERMYDTRYQKQVADMKAAGLNPMLSYITGAPSGPVSSSQSASPGQPGQMTERYNQSKIATAQEAQINSQTQKTISEKSNIDIDTINKSLMPGKIAAEIGQLVASAGSADSQKEALRAQADETRQNIRNLEQRLKLDASNVQVNESLMVQRVFLNALTQAEIALTKGKGKQTGLENIILGPKARAADTTGGEMAARANNMGDIGRSVWQVLLPTIGR